MIGLCTRQRLNILLTIIPLLVYVCPACEGSGSVCQPYASEVQSAALCSKTQMLTSLSLQIPSTQCNDTGVVFTVTFNLKKNNVGFRTINYTLQDYKQFIICLTQETSFGCDLNTNTSFNCVHEYYTNFNNVTYFTCHYNLTQRVIHCSKANFSYYDTLGFINVSGKSKNVTVYLSWESGEELTLVRWKDFTDVKFTCLVGRSGKIIGTASVTFNVAGSCLAIFVIILFFMAVYHSVKVRKRRERELSALREDELEKVSSANSRCQLIQQDNTAFDDGDYKISDDGDNKIDDDGDNKIDDDGDNKIDDDDDKRIDDDGDTKIVVKF